MLKIPPRLLISQAGNIWNSGVNQFIKIFIILISKERVGKVLYKTESLREGGEILLMDN